MTTGITSEGIKYAVHNFGNAVAYCALSIKAGTRDEEGFHSGIAHFVEHTLFKGTARHNSDYINNRLEQLGGELNAYTTKEEIVLHATVLKKDIAKAASLLAEIAFESTFPDEEIEIEKGVVIDEIASYKDSPSEDIYDVFEEKLFAGSPLAKLILGTPESVQAISSEELRRFRSTFFTPERMSFSVVGPLPEEKMEEMIRGISAGYRDICAGGSKAVAREACGIGRGTAFDETVDKVTAQMKAETGEMLKARQNEFSQASSQSLGQIVNPLKENIADLKKAMEEGRKDQAERSGEMREHIRNLISHSDAARKSADELAAAFKHGSKVQGDWGETILEELLSSQGLTKGVHFETQAVMRDGDGKVLHSVTGGSVRPDVILHLDEKREVIIDSKVSLTSYVDYVNAENETDRQNFLKAHVDSIRKHVKELSDKDARAVSRMLHSIGDLERLGDHAVNIAEAAENLYLNVLLKWNHIP